MKKTLCAAVLAIFVLIFCACNPKINPTKTTLEAKEKTNDDYKIVLSSRYGKEVYESKCGSCHNLKKTTDYTFAEWNPIMDRMAKKADLDYLQKQNVLGYLKDNAKAEK